MQVTEILLFNTPNSVYAAKTDKYEVNSRVVVSMSGNLELGVIKGETNINEDLELVEIVRQATNEDNKTHCENCKYARSLLPDIKQTANSLNLNMKIGNISTSFDRSKLTVNYTAEERVDFRELIKILASKYKARIDMHQIGNRDETKLVGALGVCGRETCCKAFLSDFDKVSIKMAKNQNIALNPNRINGMCGRLLCCLKYEDEFYEEMQKKMPRVGFIVTTPDGKGSVSSTDFLKETVTVTFTKDESTEIKTYNLTDIQFNQKAK